MKSTAFSKDFTKISNIFLSINKLIIDNLAKTKKNKTLDILDAGCGDGKTTAYLSSVLSQAKILGIDNSEALINYANKNFSNTNIHFKTADIKNIKKQLTYDYIFSFFCLHFVKFDILEETILKLSKALKPAGELIITLPAQDKKLFNLRKNFLEQHKIKFKEHQLIERPDLNCYLGEFEKSSENLKIVENQSCSFDSQLTKYEFRILLSNICKEYRALKDPELKEDFLREISNCMLKKPDSNTVNFHLKYLYLRCKKK